MPGKLKVTVIKAERLPSKDISSGSSDPYCKVKISREEKGRKKEMGNFKTKVVKKNLNPYWNETFTLDVESPDRDQLLLEVYDKDLLSKDDFIGSCYISLKDLFRDMESERCLSLNGTQGGRITVKMLATGFGAMPMKTSLTSTTSDNSQGTHYGSPSQVSYQPQPQTSTYSATPHPQQSFLQQPQQPSPQPQMVFQPQLQPQPQQGMGQVMGGMLSAFNSAMTSYQLPQSWGQPQQQPSQVSVQPQLQNLQYGQQQMQPTPQQQQTQQLMNPLAMGTQYQPQPNPQPLQNTFTPSLNPTSLGNPYGQQQQQPGPQTPFGY